MVGRLYTTKQLARLKGVNVWQVQYCVRTGKLVPDHRVGRDWVFLESTADGWTPPRNSCGRKPRPSTFGPGMLTLREAARRMGVSVEDVRSLVARGLLPVDGKRSGVRYVTEETLDGVLQGS